MGKEEEEMRKRDRKNLRKSNDNRMMRNVRLWNVMTR